MHILISNSKNVLISSTINPYKKSTSVYESVCYDRRGRKSYRKMKQAILFKIFQQEKFGFKKFYFEAVSEVKTVVKPRRRRF